MKSPLVDALRLASGQDTAANSEPADAEAEFTKPADDSPPTEPQPGLSDQVQVGVPELSLMDATDVLVVQSAGEDDEFAASQVLAESAVNEAVADAPLPAAVEPDAYRPVIARLGMLSPLLCLLLASVATGSYFLYQGAGGKLRSVGLGMPAPQLGARADSVPAVEPATPINRFPLLGASRASTPGPQSSQRTTPAALPAAAFPGGEPAATSARGALDDKAFAVLNDAFAAYESGDLGGAEAAYRRALAISPRHPNALQGLAAILHRTDRVDAALEYYEMLLSVDPNNTEAAAALLAGRGKSAAPATEAEIKVLLQRHPGASHLHFALGTLMAEQGRWADARLGYYRALAIEPQNPEYQFNLAVSLENLGQYDDARARYESVLANVTDASAIDSRVVASRIALLAERSATTGQVQ